MGIPRSDKRRPNEGDVLSIRPLEGYPSPAEERCRRSSRSRRVDSRPYLFLLRSTVAVGTVSALAGRGSGAGGDGFHPAPGVLDPEAGGDAAEDHQDAGDDDAEVERGGRGGRGIGGERAAGDAAGDRVEAGGDDGAEDRDRQQAGDAGDAV